MGSGINLVCKRGMFQFLITNKPYCLINNVETKQLQWNKEIFISLQPDMDYQISVQFPYMGKSIGTAKFVIKLQPDEIQTYQYKTPGIITSPGKIKRIS